MALRFVNRLLRPLGLSVVRNDYYPQTADMFCDAEVGFGAAYEQVEGYSLTSYERMFALYKAVDYVSRAHILGGLVECGVWRGGSAMMMAVALLERQDNHRRLYLYDTYEGMPAPGVEDKDYGGRHASEIFTQEAGEETLNNLTAGLDEVQQNMSRTGYPTHLIHYVQGKVEDTLPDVIPESIALARLDTDFYQSTLHELQQLWPRITRGGVVIIDDYGHWKGARQATDDFFAELGIAVLLQRIDYTARLVIKP